MKKILLAIIGITTAYVGFAQISFDKNNVSCATHASEFEIVGYNNFINHSSDSIFVWERTNVSLTTNWENAICDNINCWPVGQSTGQIKVKPGTSASFSSHFYPYNSPGTGSMELKVYPQGDISKAVTATYTANGWGLSSENPDAPSDFAVFPNPATDRVTVRFTCPAERRVELLDNMGHVLEVRELNMEELSVELEIDEYPCGIYFIKVTKKNSGAYTTANFAKTDSN